MSVKVAINGFGRIGRQVFKILHEEFCDEVEVLAVNDLTDDTTLAHLLKYDSVYGTFDSDISVADGAIVVDGCKVTSLAERDPAKLPWADMGVQVVLESTGFFTNAEGAGKHLEAGAKKVLISAPCKGDADNLVTLVLGVNDDTYDPAKHSLISNASCTTSSLAPMA